MPRTRQDIDRDTKVIEILDAAERRLRRGGHTAVSVPAIARELGVAHNAIYWYFPSKDELLVATFDHIIGKLLKRKPKTTPDPIDKILWFVDQMGDLYPIRASLTERASTSKVVARYLNDLNARLRTMATNVLRPHVPEKELDLTVSTFLSTVQGLFVGQIPRKERREIVTFALQRLVPE